MKTKDKILSETSEETKQKARDYGDSLVEGTFEQIKKQIRYENNNKVSN